MDLRHVFASASESAFAITYFSALHACFCLLMYSVLLFLHGVSEMETGVRAEGSRNAGERKTT